VWVKLDDGIADHPKFFDAGRHLGRHGIARAFAVYVAGLAYANKHLTDGFLSESVVKSFKIDRKPGEIALVLGFADVGLWDPVPGGWRIHDYHHHNPKSQDVKDKRERDAARKRQEREEKDQRVRSDSTRSPRRSRARDPVLDPDPVPVQAEDHAALRTAERGKPVENPKRRRPPVEATNVLRALVWREVASLYRSGGPAPHHGDVIEHLKCTAARAGLIYAVDDFHNQAELAIARFSSPGAARDAERSEWRAAGRPGR
jgi:hypothetical protein